MTTTTINRSKFTIAFTVAPVYSVIIQLRNITDIQSNELKSIAGAECALSQLQHNLLCGTVSTAIMNNLNDMLIHVSTHDWISARSSVMNVIGDSKDMSYLSNVYTLFTLAFKYKLGSIQSDSVTDTSTVQYSVVQPYNMQ